MTDRKTTTPEPEAPLVEVRPAVPEEAQLIADFQKAMALESEDRTLPAEIIEPGVRAVFEDPTRGRYWMATIDGQVVGSLLVTTEWSDWRNGTVWWIQSAYVVPEARGKKVFSTLYRHLAARVERDPTLRGIRLYVERNNTSAQRVYEALGMDREHYEMFEWMPGE